MFGLVTSLAQIPPCFSFFCSSPVACGVSISPGVGVGSGGRLWWRSPELRVQLNNVAVDVEQNLMTVLATDTHYDTL